MSITADILRSHIDYTAWASQRLVEAAAALPETEIIHDFKTADKSVLGTLVHIYVSDRIWLARLQNAPHSVPANSAADLHLAVLQNDWPILHNRWKQWAVGLTDESVQQILSYTDTRGRQWEEPLWQLILHVVNHGTHHRGQVSGFLRSLGHTPPALDMTLYYRSLTAGRE
ncbi:MAG TPA: DinB family protein [Bryobacteraceae bacterium]|nr:DinB family protein [Bryobacteraceae bacterium]